MIHLEHEEWLGSTMVTQAAIEPRRETLLALGFRPAFYDYATGATYLSRGADGWLSSEHVLDGLPDRRSSARD